jgi:hypothetical protein
MVLICVDFRYLAIQKAREKINKTDHSDLRTGSCKSATEEYRLGDNNFDLFSPCKQSVKLV